MIGVRAGGDSWSKPRAGLDCIGSRGRLSRRVFDRSERWCGVAIAGVLDQRLPLPRPPRRGRLGPSALISALLHLLLLAALIWFAERSRPKAPHWLPPPSVRMVFQGGGGKAASVPNRAPPVAHRPASPAPVPVAPPAFAPPPAPVVPRAVPPPVAQPPPPAPSRPAPVPRLIPVPTERLPLPPPVPAAPARPAPARPARPVLRFPAPTGFSLGTPSAAPSRVAPAPRAVARRPARGLDLSFAPEAAGGSRLSLDGLLDRDGVGPDWTNAFHAWLERHAYYPRDAGEFGEQGNVVVDFVVDKSGRVSGLRLASSSGYPILDMAVLSMLRDATLPALPPQNGARLPVRFTMHYVLQ